MLMKEVSRALEELAEIIARLQFVAAELAESSQARNKAPTQASSAIRSTVDGAVSVPEERACLLGYIRRSTFPIFSHALAPFVWQNSNC